MANERCLTVTAHQSQRKASAMRWRSLPTHPTGGSRVDALAGTLRELRPKDHSFRSVGALVFHPTCMLNRCRKAEGLQVIEIKFLQQIQAE